MHQTRGPGWTITTDTSSPMLIALYLKDNAGLTGAGLPPVAPAQPRIREADHHQLTQHVGGIGALRREWEAWWARLIEGDPDKVPEVAPPEFSAFSDAPALQRSLQAHFGSALTWARERRADYERLEARREARGTSRMLEEMVASRQLEVGPEAKDFNLTIIELPLAEDRAWLVNTDKVIMSQSLMEDPETFRSYLEPVLAILV
ncbi:hypothetical protein SPF06_00575 [Sinomonas sp. JGH33]|uniref:Uncharacterized protein n=1 Tax=Sinomonas terricola TaxID=3110330 RepID=A0ABU5T0M6_9MICC|nr:hypothetical protein [Sinomonas sp. JGH33]MEA5453203.1 hypothetical protein [Sinomonas sp. JGH33]